MVVVVVIEDSSVLIEGQRNLSGDGSTRTLDCSNTAAGDNVTRAVSSNAIGSVSTSVALGEAGPMYRISVGGAACRVDNFDTVVVVIVVLTTELHVVCRSGELPAITESRSVTIVDLAGLVGSLRLLDGDMAPVFAVVVVAFFVTCGIVLAPWFADVG